MFSLPSVSYLIYAVLRLVLRNILGKPTYLREVLTQFTCTKRSMCYMYYAGCVRYDADRSKIIHKELKWFAKVLNNYAALLEYETTAL